MELEGAKRSFDEIKGKEKLPIKTFVSDRHRGIGKWMRTMQRDTTHYYDIWHQPKSTVKKVLKASKEKSWEILAQSGRNPSGIIYTGVLHLPKLGFQPL